MSSGSALAQHMGGRLGGINNAIFNSTPGVSSPSRRQFRVESASAISLE